DGRLRDIDADTNLSHVPSLSMRAVTPWRLFGFTLKQETGHQAESRSRGPRRRRAPVSQAFIQHTRRVGDAAGAHPRPRRQALTRLALRVFVNRARRVVRRSGVMGKRPW